MTSNLPDAHTLYALSKRTLEGGAQFEGVAANLDDVVEEPAHGGHGEGGREERHVPELNEHLQVVLKRVLILVGGEIG